MPRGIVIGEKQWNVVPSSHYARVLDRSSAFLRPAAADFIDGRRVAAGTDDSLIQLFWFEGDSSAGQVALQDTSSGTMFIAHLASRTQRDLISTPDNFDPRGSPRLPDDFLRSRHWELYNCRLVLTLWSRDRFSAGRRP